MLPVVDFDLATSGRRPLNSVGIVYEVFGRLTGAGNAFVLPWISSTVFVMLGVDLADNHGIDRRLRLSLGGFSLSSTLGNSIAE